MAKKEDKATNPSNPVVGDLWECTTCGMRVICIVDCKCDGTPDCLPHFDCCGIKMIPV